MQCTHVREDHTPAAGWKVHTKQMLMWKGKLRPVALPPAPPFCSSGQRALPGDAEGSRIPGLVLLQGWAESGVGLRADVEGTGSLAGLSGSCISSGHKYTSMGPCVLFRYICRFSWRREKPGRGSGQLHTYSWVSVHGRTHVSKLSSCAGP